MIGYTKLFQQILTSSVWCEDDTTRLVWVTLLALKGRDHVVRASLPGLAHQARVTFAATEKAIEKFLAPDPHSISKEHEGRRIKEVPGGWFILNGEIYQQKMNYEERKEYNRKKQAEYRARLKEEPTVMQSSSILTEPPSGFPKTEQEAVDRGAAAGADAETCRVAWNLAASRGWTDSKGQTIRSWPHFVKGAALMNGERKSEQQRRGNGSQPKKTHIKLTGEQQAQIAAGNMKDPNYD